MDVTSAGGFSFCSTERDPRCVQGKTGTFRPMLPGNREPQGWCLKGFCHFQQEMEKIIVEASMEPILLFCSFIEAYQRSMPW